MLRVLRLLSELGIDLPNNHCEEVLALRGNPDISKPSLLNKAGLRRFTGNDDILDYE